MDPGPGLVVAVVAAALVFAFVNGMHDAANSIATVVSTRVLTPFVAVVWAASFNFIALVVFDLQVAGTISRGILEPRLVDAAVIIGTLGGAMAWNILTWWWALPSSSSHALVGGMLGAGIAKAGLGGLVWSRVTTTGIFIFISPLIGLVASGMLLVGFAWLLRRQTPGRTERWFRRLQVVSAAAFSLNHGGNDAQKTMGIIALLLFSAGHFGDRLPSNEEFPRWIVVSCYLSIALGTLAGGWRIVRTMGMRLTKLSPFGGVCAETGGSLAVFLATTLGIPVSTTHTITGAIIGVGVVSNPTRVHWRIASRILWAWLLTIPAAAIMSAVGYFLARAAGI
jgi:PiT family inorganic phosphate transporter